MAHPPEISSAARMATLADQQISADFTLDFFFPDILLTWIIVHQVRNTGLSCKFQDCCRKPDMNFVSTVASTLNQFRNRVFVASVTRTEKIYLHSIRFVVSGNHRVEKFRLWILVRARGIADAELNAETCVNEVICTCKDLAHGDAKSKMLKPREVTVATLSGESEEVLCLLQRMRRENSRLVSSFEKVGIE